MKFEIEETDMEEKEINEEIDEVDEMNEDGRKEYNSKEIPNFDDRGIFDDKRNETEDSIYSEEGSSALLDADGLTPEEEGFMKGYMDE